MIGPWYIDAIDVRGGLAVGSLRQADLCGERVKERGPSVFIAPPSFVPEFVHSQFIGLTLARARAQAGLFNEGQEVAFDTLAALVEFVRRTYIRGSGGDGAGESGGSFPPPLPPDAGESPPEPEGLGGMDLGEEQTDPVAAVSAMVRENSSGSKLLKIGESQRAYSLAMPNPTAAGASSTRSRRLARGALWALQELMRRRPSPHSENLHWATTCAKLVSLLFRMGLWPIFLQEFRDPDAAYEWIMGSGEVRDEHEGMIYHALRLDPYHWDRYYWPWGGGAWALDADAFDDLAAFPLPKKIVPFKEPKSQNLHGVLAALMATPIEVGESAKQDEERIAELAIFAAASINLGRDYAPFGGFHLAYSMQFADQLVVRAQQWLSANAPKLVYAPPVESIVAQASQVPT
jgi:hypothetical protein